MKITNIFKLGPPLSPKNPLVSNAHEGPITYSGINGKNKIPVALAAVSARCPVGSQSFTALLSRLTELPLLPTLIRFSLIPSIPL